MKSDFPRVLVVSDSCISPTQGTGTATLRHFSAYPADKISQAYFAEAGVPVWSHSVRFNRRLQRRGPGDALLNGVSRVYNAVMWRIGRREWLYQRPVTFEPQTTEAIREMPEVVYSVAYSDTGLALADQLTAALPPDPADPDEIAGAVKSLWDSPELCGTLRERGRIRASTWTHREFFEGMLAIFKEFEPQRSCWGNDYHPR
jgi:hypothetical protein